ncbi:MAG: putative phosphatase, partial [Deltaproteobacteria bacterium]|nr:putative phosphatase [Deltaproteobacteria bacterium]
DVSLETTVKAIAWGALMGARGNSGIILAQILSGVAEGIEGKDRLSAEDVAFSFSRAVKKAYKAILHPAEGTILTVVRETAEAAVEAAKTTTDLAFLIDEMVKTARASVERTPELLPKLKEAGVVDAGGLGFLYFLEGMLYLIRGVTIDDVPIDDEKELACMSGEESGHQLSYRYCTEFVLKGSQISEDALKKDLSLKGDSIVVVGDSRLARVHIHTGQPQEVLQYASALGQVSSIKVDDMLVQHTSRLVGQKSTKASSVVAIVLGDGFKEIFYNAGAELVVDGGPTQNPSTMDIVSAIETVESLNVIILPNHKNIYPSAIQAVEMTTKQATVLKTSSPPEGISALLAYMDEAPYEENINRMGQASQQVKSGEVLVASRDVTLGGIQVKTNDFIGIYKGEIQCSFASMDETLPVLVKRMHEPSDEIITLFFGDTVKKSDAETMQSILQMSFPDKTVELYYGGQSHAHYIVSVE